MAQRSLMEAQASFLSRQPPKETTAAATITDSCAWSSPGHRGGDGMPEEWVQISREHLRAAELLLKEGLYHLVSFHAQRAAANALQAMLDKNGARSPCGGMLLERLNACAAFDAELLSLRASCALLDLYLSGDPDAVLP